MIKNFCYIALFASCSFPCLSIAGNYSCTEQLKNQKWPLDCLLLLQLQPQNKTSTKHKYFLIDQWCKIYSSELQTQTPPDALFSLHLPQNCLNIASAGQKHSQSIEVLSGSFLNSFP